MPRFCQLGPNCVGPKKAKAPAGYEIGIIPGPPYKKEQRFCSLACVRLDYNARKQHKRNRQREKTKTRSEKKIAKLRARGHVSCPCCKESI
jgi:hypothetical protein